MHLDQALKAERAGQGVLYSLMANQSKVGFSSRAGDNMTDELVCVLSGGASLDFKELFLLVFAAMKLKKTAKT